MTEFKVMWKNDTQVKMNKVEKTLRPKTPVSNRRHVSQIELRVKTPWCFNLTFYDYNYWKNSIAQRQPSADRKFEGRVIIFDRLCSRFTTPNFAEINLLNVEVIYHHYKHFMVNTIAFQWYYFNKLPQANLCLAIF